MSKTGVCDLKYSLLSDTTFVKFKQVRKEFADKSRKHRFCPSFRFFTETNLAIIDDGAPPIGGLYSTPMRTILADPNYV